MEDIHAPDEDGFILGIFNWCDRRCERCRFARQCRMGIEEVDDPSGREPTDAEKETGIIGANLAKAWKMLMDRAKEEDWEEEPMEAPDADWHEFQELRHHNASEHPLGRAGMAYSKLVKDWTDGHREAMEARGVTVHRTERTPVTPMGASPEMLVLNEALEEIGWFKHMLHAKCQRALRGRSDGPLYEGETVEESWQSDWNGTAKLCNAIIERCISAWVTVAETSPDTEAGILPILAHLRHCHGMLHHEFPDLDKFVRPGFDAPRQPAW